MTQGNPSEEAENAALSPMGGGETGRCMGNLSARPVSPGWDHIHGETAGPMGAHRPTPPAPGETNPE